MSRYRGPRVRIRRRLGELPGLTNKVTTKQSAPGQHGLTKKKKKPSQYAIRLQEKQKLRFNYGITESQLISYVRKARKIKGSTGEILLQLLEMRLDNIVFRLGIAPTIAAARQLISHGHIIVNSKKISIPSYQCQIKDTISIAEKQQSQQLIKFFFENKNNNSTLCNATHLTLNQDNFIGTVNNIVNRQTIGLHINELLIVEHYSRKI